MYFVDRRTIEAKLSLMDSHLHFFTSKNSWTTLEDKLSLERVAHIVVEAIIDVGNSIIDGFIMRDPGSYEDIIDILLDEKVIRENEASCYKEVLTLRTMVVRDYIHVDHQVIEVMFKRNLSSLTLFSTFVNDYLKNELGHVTAFIPEKE